MQRFSPESKIGLLEKRTPAALELLKDCSVCPRECRIDRAVRLSSPKSAGKASMQVKRFILSIINGDFVSKSPRLRRGFDLLSSYNGSLDQVVRLSKAGRDLSA